jgi:hypothetical protein
MHSLIKGLLKLQNNVLDGLHWACFGDLTYPDVTNNNGVVVFFETGNLKAMTSKLTARKRACLVAFNKTSVVLVGGLINGMATNRSMLVTISEQTAQLFLLKYPRIEAVCLNIGSGRIFIFGGVTESSTRLFIFWNLLD